MMLISIGEKQEIMKLQTRVNELKFKLSEANEKVWRLTEDLDNKIEELNQEKSRSKALSLQNNYLEKQINKFKGQLGKC